MMQNIYMIIRASKVHKLKNSLFQFWLNLAKSSNSVTMISWNLKLIICYFFSRGVIYLKLEKSLMVTIIDWFIRDVLSCSKVLIWCIYSSQMITVILPSRDNEKYYFSIKEIFWDIYVRSTVLLFKTALYHCYSCTLFTEIK